MSNNLQLLEQSPIEAVNSEKVTAMANRVRTMIPDGKKLTGEQALTIAQLSILTRTLPGRDVHYFLDKSGNLKMSDDYKFLRAWATRREQFVTGDSASSFEESYIELDETAKIREGISPNDFATFCISLPGASGSHFAGRSKAGLTWALVRLKRSRCPERY